MTIPDDTTEGLREQVPVNVEEAVAVAVRSAMPEGYELAELAIVRVVVEALSRLHDPGDLPARMAAAMRTARDQWVNPDDYATNAPEVGEHFAAAALSVRWEAAVQASAAADELRRRLAYAGADLAAARDDLQALGERLSAVEAERDALKAEWRDRALAADAEVVGLKARLAETKHVLAEEIAAIAQEREATRRADVLALIHERDALRAAIERVRAQGTFWSVCAAETVAAFGRGVLAALDAPETPEERNA